jgi:hypothetical protein
MVLPQESVYIFYLYYNIEKMTCNIAYLLVMKIKLIVNNQLFVSHCYLHHWLKALVFFL